MNRNRFVSLGPVAFLAFSMPVLAHHSGSAYDRDHQNTLKGAVITFFELSNPHSRIEFVVKDRQGKVQKWIGEGPSPSQMIENGWTKDTLRPGDKVNIVGNLAKNGSPSLRIRWVTLPNGKDLFAYLN